MTDITNLINDLHLLWINNKTGGDIYLQAILNIISNIPFEEMIHSEYYDNLVDILTKLELKPQNTLTLVEVRFMDIVTPPPPPPILIRH